MTTTVTIMVADFDLKVSGSYRRATAATLKCPATWTFEVRSVVTDDARDITHLIGRDDMVEINGLALAAYLEDQARLRGETARDDNVASAHHSRRLPHTAMSECEQCAV